MCTLNIYSRKDGIILTRREQSNSGHGAMLTIKNESISNAGISTRIVCSCIEFPRIITGDVNGGVYLYNLQNNKFFKVAKIGNCCTAVAFANALYPHRDVLVSSSNRFFYVLQSSSGKVVAKLSGHSSPISHISVDNKCYVAVTSSTRQTMVWDLQNLTLQHEIILPLDIDLVKSLLVPPYESIVSLYKKDKICFWNHLTSKYSMSFEMNTHQMDCSLVVNSADVSRDGKLLLLGGRANWLLCWKIDALNECATQPMVISLSRHVRSVSKLAFVNLSFQQTLTIYTALIISQEGIMYLYEVITNKLIRKIQELDDRFLNLHCSLYSDKVVAITVKGFAKVYFIEKLVTEEDFGECKETEKLVDETIAEDLLKGDASNRVRPQTMERLKGILREYGKFPDKYRYIIWSNFLDLHENSGHFKALFKMGIHSSYSDLDEQCPIVNPILSRALKTYVEGNWASRWFLEYPYLNSQIMMACESLLTEHDHHLFIYLTRYRITPRDYGWTLLKSLFSEVLDDKAWITFSDHLIANPTEFLIYLVVSFSIVMKKRLFQCQNRDTFMSIYSNEAASNDTLMKLISKAYQLYQSTSYSVREQIRAAIGEKRFHTPNKEYPTLEFFPALAFDYEIERETARLELKEMKTRQEIILNEQSVDMASQNYSRFKENLIEDRDSGACAFSSAINDVPRDFRFYLFYKHQEKVETSKNVEEIIQPMEVTRKALSTRCHLARLQHQKNHPNGALNSN